MNVNRNGYNMNQQCRQNWVIEGHLTGGEGVVWIVDPSCNRPKALKKMMMATKLPNIITDHTESCSGKMSISK